MLAKCSAFVPQLDSILIKIKLFILNVSTDFYEINYFFKFLWNIILSKRLELIAVTILLTKIWVQYICLKSNSKSYKFEL